MSWFQNASIRTKLTLLMVAVVSIVVTLLCVAFMVNDARLSKRSLVDHVSALADVLGANSTAALDFGDNATAAELLSSLHLEPAVEFACTYDEQGRLFACYPADGAAPSLTAHESATFVDGEASYFDGDRLHVYRRIMLGDHPIGTIYLRGNLRDLRLRLLQNTLLLSVLLAASLVLVYVLASLLQRVISAPILHLAEATQKISATGDYSIRVEISSHDELGTLCDGFNEMLTQIQQRDEELEQHRNHLGELVEQRTRDVQVRTLDLARTNEELERSNRDLDDFAYIASHDLREPLRGISNYATFLSEDYEDKLDDDGREKLATLNRLCQRMDAQISSLLHYSRVGRGDLAIIETDMNELLTDVLDSMQITLEADGVEIRVPRPLPTVTCDAVRIREVFHNLINNAAKYNDKPEKWIEIGWQLAASQELVSSGGVRGCTPGGYPVFYVADNGIGIKEKHQDSIFRIFKRLHGRDKFGGGTGAGLTFVKQIVERHGGRIWVESELGQGSKFLFTLTSGHDACKTNESANSDR